MNFSDLLKRRRMVRNYLPDPIPEDSLQRILWAALQGPSAGNSQGISVVVVREADRRKAIAQLAGEDYYVQKGYPAWLSNAPIHLVLCVESSRYRTRYALPDKAHSKLSGPQTWSIPYWYVDGGAAFMLILLAAVEEGLSAGFQGAHNLGAISQLLKIPPEVEVLGLITLGYPAPDRRSGSLEHGRRQSTEAIHQETWG